MLFLEAVFVEERVMFVHYISVLEISYLKQIQKEWVFFILFQSYLLGKAINYTFYLKNYGGF